MTGVDATAGGAVTPWDRRRDGRAVLLLFLLVWAIYLATASYGITQVNDTRETAMSAWSLGTRGTLALPQEWAEYPDAMRWDVEGEDGRTYTNRFPGTVAWAAPFYTVAEVVTDREEPAHPWLVDFRPAGVAAATVAALAVAVWFGVYRRLVDRRLALLAAGTLAFATGMWSVAGTALWTHGPGALLLGLGVLAMSSRRHAWAGAALGAGILVRPHLAVVPAVMGLWAGARRRSLRPVVVVGVVSALGLAGMSLYSKVLFGTWLPVAGYDPQRPAGVVTTGGTDFLERLALWAAHPLRGMFIYTPFLLVLVPGLIRAWRAAPAWVRSAAVAGLTYLVVQLRVNVWHGGGGFFGNRLGLELLVLASPLLLLAAREFALPVRMFRWALVALVAASVAIHAVGATAAETGFYEPDWGTVWEGNLDELCEQEPDLCPKTADG